MKIKDSVPLVTGANGGIGRALVRELLKRGATKIYVAARDRESLRGLLAESSNLVPITLDVTNPKQIQAAAKAASDITLLINNAGAVAFSGVLAAKDTVAAREEMEVNYFGVMALTQALHGTPAFRSGGASSTSCRSSRWQPCPSRELIQRPSQPRWRSRARCAPS